MNTEIADVSQYDDDSMSATVFTFSNTVLCVAKDVGGSTDTTFQAWQVPEDSQVVKNSEPIAPSEVPDGIKSDEIAMENKEAPENQTRLELIDELMEDYT